jgi:hypothetical protein
MALEVTPLPIHGEVFMDARGDDHTCRVSWREADGTFVLSIWRGAHCAASFQLPRADLPAFVSSFLVQLSESPIERRESA